MTCETLRLLYSMQLEPHVHGSPWWSYVDGWMRLTTRPSASAPFGDVQYSFENQHELRGFRLNR